MVAQRFLRWLLFPARYGATHFPRGNALRSLCVLLLKPVSKSTWLLKGLKSIEPLDNHQIRFAPSDSMVLSATYWFGVQGYEGILASVWQSLCKDASAVLEIGGNIGFFTVLGAQQSAARYAVVEPVPHICSVLRENLKMNRIENVEVLQAAAIPETQRTIVTLTIPAEGREIPTGAYLSKDTEITGRQTDREIRTEGIPARELISGRDLVKIDAEGIEHALIGSCIDEVVRHRPTLVLEMLPESVLLAELVRTLAAQCKYRILIVPAYHTDTLVEVDPEQFSSTLPSRHYSKDVILTLKSLPEFPTIRMQRQ